MGVASFRALCAKGNPARPWLVRVIEKQASAVQAQDEQIKLLTEQRGRRDGRGGDG